jgi:cytochrome P450
LEAELQHVLGAAPPTAADVPGLPFTNAVIAEAMRLHPPLWSIAREAASDTHVGGVAVAGGTLVMLSPWTMQRDARFFDEPDAFRPERWLDGLAERLPRFAYFPFGGRPRQCIGNAFALLEASLVLATVAQRYRLELLSDQDTITPAPRSTLRPASRIIMRVEAANGPSSAESSW